MELAQVTWMKGINIIASWDWLKSHSWSLKARPETTTTKNHIIEYRNKCWKPPRTGRWGPISLTASQVFYHVWLQPAQCEKELQLTLFGLATFFSARSTLVNTNIVLFPWGSIWLTKSVTILRSASTDPSKINTKFILRTM